MGADYRVRYAKSVLEFMCNGIQARKAYDRVDSYRMILALFPEARAVLTDQCNSRLHRLACAGKVVTHLAQAYIAAYESASSIRVPLESSWRGMSAYIACHLAGILKGTANIAGDS